MLVWEMWVWASTSFDMLVEKKKQSEHWGGKRFGVPVANIFLHYQECVCGLLHAWVKTHLEVNKGARTPIVNRGALIKHFFPEFMFNTHTLWFTCKVKDHHPCHISIYMSQGGHIFVIFQTKITSWTLK